MRGLISFAIVFSFSASLAQAAPHGIYPTRSQRALEQIFSFKMASSTKDGAQKLEYYGGPVLANVKVYSVMWGASVDATTQKQIGDFFSNTVNSSYMDWLKEYNTSVTGINGHAGTNQTIGRGSFAGQITITPTNTATNLDDAAIQTELDQQVTKGVLPKPDANTLFMTYFPAGITITIDGQASCQAFCAYHEGFTSQTNGNIFYGVMPDQGGACALGCGFGAAFDNLTAVSSHEMIEATTDPFPTPATSPAFPQAWNTTDGNEIGDLCVGTSTQLTTQGLSYNLQQEFDNASAACAAGPYQSP